MPYGHLNFLFGEVSVLRLLFNQVICFLGVEAYDFFIYNLDVSPLSDESFMNIFSHTVGCLFVLLMVSFAVQKLFSLM